MISSYTVSQLGHVFLRHSVDRREMLEHRQSQRLKRLTGGGGISTAQRHITDHDSCVTFTGLSLAANRDAVIG